MQKKVYIIAGGTMVHIRPHFSVCAPAYGSVGKQLYDALWRVQKHDPAFWRNLDREEESDWEETLFDKFILVPIYTKMAKGDETWDGYPGHFSDAMEFRKQLIADAGLERGIETNDDMAKLVDHLISREDTRCIIMAAAICDWEPSYMSQDEVRVDKSITMISRDENGNVAQHHPNKYINLNGDFLRDEFGKDKPRLSSRLEGFPDHRKGITLRLKAADKIIGRIRQERKDIFLVTFKTTAGVSAEETYAAGLKSLKGSSSNLVLANDVQNHHNVVVTPEEFPYYGTREEALKELAEMAFARMQLDFIRTAVIEGERASIPELHAKGNIPANFIPVMAHLIERGAYKPLPWKDSTSGHFGCIVENEEFSRISSVRKANHNRCMDEGVAKVFSDESDAEKILAAGAKPSVGEHTQRMIYDEIQKGDWSPSRLGEAHSIVHFHCELRPFENTELVKQMGEAIFRPPTRPQKPFECGSVQCGINTAQGMQMAEPGIWWVHLEGHGPNIAWHRDVDPARVINLIEKYWDLDQKSGGNLS